MNALLYGKPVERAPELDDDIMGQAWRFTTPCTDDCGHPIHGFNKPHGRRHIEWISEGNLALKEAPCPA